jgi:formate dehydrogenase iron-sulfur subunit
VSKAVLYDAVKCIGCRGCQIACKNWNNLPEIPSNKNVNKGNYDSPKLLSDRTFTKIHMVETEDNGKLRWTFAKLQCMHCEEPACVTACPIRALRKTKDGPVIYDKTKCFGCRYCMVSCPFHIPNYEWDSTLPWVRKCTFCVDRQKAGLRPACVSTCPTGALQFGDREELLTEAKQRIAGTPGKYVDHIYGEKELGGTSWMYLSPIPFEQLGFEKFGSDPVPKNAERAMKLVPPVLVGVAAVCAGLYWVIQRREENSKEKVEKK